MAITINSPLAGDSQASSLNLALSYVENHDALDTFTDQYVRALYDLCVAIGLRFELAFAQWCDETGVGSSQLWRIKRNPAGIGALDGGIYVGIIYKTPEESARGHLVHLWLYVKGTSLPAALAPYIYLDPRWQAAIEKGKAGSAPTLKGLAASWATNPAYATQIAGHANAAFRNLPEGATNMAENIVFGRVPHPGYVDDYIDDFPGQAFDYIGQRMNWGVVWHRMVGTLQGTRQHFRSPGTGLTDYGVGVAGPDSQSDDGKIYRWNDPLGQRSGWANGRVIAPWGDGLAFIKEFSPTYGVDIANRGQVSIEISGQYGTPLTAKSRASIVALTAYWADQAKIPWDVFPLWPNHGYSFVRWHQELTGPAEKVCPGDVVIGETATLLAAVSERMRQFQVSGVVEPKPVPLYAAPRIPSWLAADVARGVMLDHTLNSAKVFGCERRYTALRDTKRLQLASLSSKEVGPIIKAGESFTGTHKIGSKWILTAHGTTIYAPDCTPEVIIKARAS